MASSCREHDFGKRECEVALMDEGSRRRSFDVNTYHRHNQHHQPRHAVEFDVEFWPVEHPIEPEDEDRPVKCPLPASSAINDGRLRKGKYAESLGKRAGKPTMMRKDGIVIVAAEQPPFQGLRKRHHTLTHGDHIITPLTTMPSLPQQKATIFFMLQQLDEL